MKISISKAEVGQHIRIRFYNAAPLEGLIESIEASNIPRKVAVSILNDRGSVLATLSEDHEAEVIE